MNDRIGLRRAHVEDREFLYRSMAQSDATPEMMGMPTYPDHPVPDFAAFVEDYDDTAFQDSDRFRQYVVMAGDRDIGAICYTINGSVAELDIWIASRNDWGMGHGTSAIGMVVDKLEATGRVYDLIMRPSARNRRAIAAYAKAGFDVYDPVVHSLPDWCLDGGADYDDAVVMTRRI